MSWRNPPIPWSELERRLSGRPASADPYPGADGGDSPAWSRKRQPYVPTEDVRGAGRAAEPPGGAASRKVVGSAKQGAGDARGAGAKRQSPYAELHCHSNFSFLDGASHPEELAEEAVRLGLDALALTDHNGFYGVVRFAEAARELGLPTAFGAELTVGESHLLVLARDPMGYARLGSVISEAQLAGEKGAPRCTLGDLADAVGNGARDHWLVLTGCRQGAVPRALVEHGPAMAQHELGRLTDVFGPANIAVELWDHGDPLDSARNDALADLATRSGVDVVATNNVHYATVARRRLATALAAVGARTSLDELDGYLPAAATAHLRSGAEQARRFARYPGVVERAAALGLECAFDLELVAPDLPPFPVPPGHDEMSWLRELTEYGASVRYGPRGNERVAGAYKQIDYELAMIDQLGFPGYFLIVWDIVEFCRIHDIYCQGRGSAANSAVCYALGITNADAVGLGLLFERFLSPERDGPPDIDLDIESDRREEAIQYVYDKHGRRNAAQVANVITYRARSSIRDMARALGYSPGQQDAWAKQVDRWSSVRDDQGEPEGGIPDEVLALATEVEHFPRHLGIHSGGMVLCDRPVVEVCPVEWASMADRSVLQWDKDDCANAGLVKFDLLGLGMLSVLHYAVDLIREHHSVDLDLATIPQEDAVYDMLCAADSVGVFQVESRAQMATLPRLRPRNFYDLVVEVALIRPGPIQGGSVHPYIRRRNGEEPVTYLHPLLENSLAKTLGVPLFQEQMMQMAIDVAGFTASEADQLRQAMGSKRSYERMDRLRERFYAGMAKRGITGDVADQIWEKLAAFANFGFPESHSVSFAYLVYSSSWIKLHYPAAFCAALLNAQPMGFYSPHTLVQDARRHGAVVRGPDVNVSAKQATLEPVNDVFAMSEAAQPPGGAARDAEADRRSRREAERSEAESSRTQRDDMAVRLGVEYVRNVGDELAERIAAGRPYRDMEDLKRRTGASLDALEALATAGTFGCFEKPDGSALERREALWGAGAVSQTGADRLEGVVTGVISPALPGMDDREAATADLWATGIAIDGHPTRFVREHLDELGVVTAADLRRVPHGERVWIGGVVTHRQRPATAGNTTFLSLEDETGLMNVICSQGCWIRYRKVARGSAALLIRGQVERNGKVVNIVAEKFEPMPVETPIKSRDFR
jgi:error-prone DNA polymerase